MMSFGWRPVMSCYGESDSCPNGNCENSGGDTGGNSGGTPILPTGGGPSGGGTSSGPTTGGGVILPILGGKPGNGGPVEMQKPAEVCDTPTWWYAAVAIAVIAGIGSHVKR